MYKNYFKIAWRSLLRQKLYAFLNIGGLTIGLICSILVFLYVQKELSYDLFYTNADQIYRVYQRQIGNDALGTDKFAVTPAVLASTLKEEYPEVLAATSLFNHTQLLSYAKDFYWERGLMADENFFKVFEHTFIYGNAQTAFKNPQSIVLTQSLAKKIFRNENPIGETITFQNNTSFTITGVIKDIPKNSSLQFSFVSDIKASRFYQEEIKQASWTSNTFHTFLNLQKGGDATKLQNKLSDLIKKYLEGEDNVYYIQALSALHLENTINEDIGLKGNKSSIYFFSWIAILIVLLAAINYTNLALVRSFKRMKEVGMRKVMGAIRQQLIGQFLAESIFITLIALVIALSVLPLILPIFNHLLAQELEFNPMQNPYLLLGLFLLVVLVGFISGSYPAFIIASLKPTQVLKGRLNWRFLNLNVQKWLLVGQYCAATVLIVSSIVIYQQFQYIQNKELGYDREHIVTISMLDRELYKHINQLENEWQTNPNILGVTTSNRLPTYIRGSSTVGKQKNNFDKIAIPIYRARVDNHFLDVFGMELVAGRNFSDNFQIDFPQGRIVNETAARALGWKPEEAIGKEIYYSDEEAMTVIGVVKDFHLQSLHMAIAPLMLKLREDSEVRFISVKLHPENLKSSLEYLESTLNKYSPFPFQYAFLDEKFDQLYAEDQRVGAIFGFFTILSILIASLGLFGLAAYSAERRTKEIGIRKVLGATIQNIVSILAEDFIKLVLIGFLLAIPIAWYFMRQWLADFAYRVEIKWWVFALSGIFALLIALLSVGIQSIKAALTNPIDSLRNE